VAEGWVGFKAEIRRPDCERCGAPHARHEMGIFCPDPEPDITEAASGR
jgi:hypothetical protein